MGDVKYRCLRCDGEFGTKEALEQHQATSCAGKA